MPLFEDIYMRRRGIGAENETAVTKHTVAPDGTPLILHADGSCNPNPGPMNVGYLLEIDSPDVELGRETLLAYGGGQVGEGTNNQAEYHALLNGLRHALRLGTTHIKIRLDSNIVVQQVNGVWKARQRPLQLLLNEAQSLLGFFKQWELKHVHRDENMLADELSRQTAYSCPLDDVAPRGEGKFAPLIRPWQAAMVRHWHLAGKRAPAVLRRVFGYRTVDNIIKVAEGQSHRTADFSDYPDWLADAKARHEKASFDSTLPSGPTNYFAPPD